MAKQLLNRWEFTKVVTKSHCPKLDSGNPYANRDQRDDGTFLGGRQTRRSRLQRIGIKRCDESNKIKPKRCDK